MESFPQKCMPDGQACFAHSVLSMPYYRLVEPCCRGTPPTHTATYPLVEFFQKPVHEQLATVKNVFTRKTDAPEQVQGKTVSSVPLSKLILSKTFATMWLMILNSAISGLIITGSYKTFGATQPQLNSDQFLSLVGSLSAIFGNAAGRFFWGAMSDIHGFKRPFTLLTLIQASAMLSYNQLAAYRPTFLLATVLMLFCMGGNFAMFPAQTMRVYGSAGASVYSIMFTAFGSAALMGPILANYLRAKGGPSLVFTVLGLLSLISTGLTYVL